MSSEPAKVEYKLVEVPSESSNSPRRSPRRPRSAPRTPVRAAPVMVSKPGMDVLQKSTKVYLSEGTVAYVVRQCSTGEYEIHVPSVSSNFRATRDEFSLTQPIQENQPSPAYEHKSPARPTSSPAMQTSTPAQQYNDPWQQKQSPSQEPAQRNFYGMNFPDPKTPGPQKNVHRPQSNYGSGSPDGFQVQSPQRREARDAREVRSQQSNGSRWNSRAANSRLDPHSPEWRANRPSDPPRQAQARPEPRNIADQLAQQANGRDFARPNQARNNGNNFRNFNNHNGSDWMSVSGAPQGGGKRRNSPPGRRQGRPPNPATKGGAPPGFGPRRPRKPNAAPPGPRRTTAQRSHPNNNKQQPESRVRGGSQNPSNGNSHDSGSSVASSKKKQPITYFKNTCRHFLSDEGCRRGSKCRFYHPGETTKVNKDQFVCAIADDGAQDDRQQGDTTFPDFSKSRGRKSGKAQRGRYEACDL